MTATKKQFSTGRIEGVVVRPLKKYVDERGWLAELFRRDEVDEEFHPVMAYISLTEPGVTRGPHEHEDQADFFCFVGPSNFKIRVWDNRPDSPTYNNVMTVYGGADNPLSIVIPKGVVHAYRNVGSAPGAVINCPNRLFMGEGRREPIDEIRHEDDPETPYRIDG